MSAAPPRLPPARRVDREGADGRSVRLRACPAWVRGARLRLHRVGRKRRRTAAGRDPDLEDRRHRGRVFVTVPVHSPGDDRAGMCIDMDYYADPARGAVPSWPNTMAEMSWRHWLTFDGLPAADRVTTLVIFVHLDGCVFPDTVRDVARRVHGPVEVAWGDGTQTDFYDQPDQVRFAVQAVGRHLTASRPPAKRNRRRRRHQPAAGPCESIDTSRDERSGRPDASRGHRAHRPARCAGRNERCQRLLRGRVRCWWQSRPPR